MNDEIPDRSGQLVARLLQSEQPGARDLLLQRERVAEGKHGIQGTMNHERRHIDLAEPIS